MKILFVSLLKRKVTSEITAARPRVIFDLASGLIKKGHDVTLLGTGDSNVPGAKILSVVPHSFVDLPVFENPFYAESAYLVQLAKKIEEIAGDYDIIHNHTYPEFINLMIADRIKTPMITTLHAQATPEFDKTLALFPDSHLVSISHAHKKQFHLAKIHSMIHNGIDTRMYSFQEKKDDYLLWLGRLSKAKNKDGSFMDPKGIRWAIQLAQETNSRLLLSGNVEDVEFFNRDVKPHLNDKIQWIGSVKSELSLTKQQVVQLMQNAQVFLMTINWYEPFGLVMAESMSCGTPVIGFDRGSVSELVIHGKTGFVVPVEKGIEGLKEALSNIGQIRSADCRNHVELNFSLEKMVNSYEDLYNDLLKYR